MHQPLGNLSPHSTIIAKLSRDLVTLPGPGTETGDYNTGSLWTTEHPWQQTLGYSLWTTARRFSPHQYSYCIVFILPTDGLCAVLSPLVSSMSPCLWVVGKGHWDHSTFDLYNEKSLAILSEYNSTTAPTCVHAFPFLRLGGKVELYMMWIIRVLHKSACTHLYGNGTFCKDQLSSRYHFPCNKMFFSILGNSRKNANYPTQVSSYSKWVRPSLP